MIWDELELESADDLGWTWIGLELESADDKIGLVGLR